MKVKNAITKQIKLKNTKPQHYTYQNHEPNTHLKFVKLKTKT